MNRTKSLIGLPLLLSLTACMPIQLPVVNHYQLQSFDAKAIPSEPSMRRSLLITQPSAAEGYQTEQMLYVKKPYQLSVFSENAWVASPANMLLPLLTQTFQTSHAFSAVVSSPYANQVDYRLDSELIAMQQNFLTQPSQFELVVKVVLTQVKNNTILYSGILTERIQSPTDTPYGGVIAGNLATAKLTSQIKHAVINVIRNYENSNKS